MAWQDPSPADTYLSLRAQVLGVGPEALGLAHTAEGPVVWGVVTELGMESGVATVVVLAEGTTSLYFSTGGGAIGAGTHPPVAEASDRLLALAESAVRTVPLAPAGSYPLPSPGRVCFWLRTFGGTLAAEAPEAELEGGEHPLSPLFRATHDVITAVRILDEHRPGG